MTDQLPSIAVVIPAFRVEPWIAGVIRAIPSYISCIVVVDDASPDETVRVVTEIGDSRVEIIRQPTNAGVGAAMLAGYKVAVDKHALIVVKVDGDGQMDPRQIGRLVRPILRGEADYTKGNRFVHGHELRQMPLVRRVGNMALSFLTKAASGYWDVFDPTNGFTAINVAALSRIDESRIHRRWLFETSMLMELYFIGAVVRDVHIPARYGDEKSSLSSTKALRDFPPRLVGAMLRRIWLRYFILDFSPVALFSVVGWFLILFGTIWGFWHFIEVVRTEVAASTGTVMIAVLPLILGAQLVLQAIVLDIQNAPKVPLSRDLALDTRLEPEDIR